MFIDCSLFIRLHNHQLTGDMFYNRQSHIYIYIYIYIIRSHNTSSCLIEVVTKAGLTIYTHKITNKMI